ncbi:2-iminobutanoate/2-iminopropanoate deaminase [Gelidibacter algens]|jgi:2-iminobutanoate/2-iminopropanoate deaminase|uniref:2-iminobutanoate/2-iminopropanoate deaminase n=1 Tax=Gelidibacter algens TaxID=49280 RepID=A0A1A7QTT5_9FLAO|nr:RidA family protein [Gelidibacter algens]OBX22728.1 reactive intermediate/imine deaminase [Gelidibacter algens]RAJ20766.1 2-iminobutanoate/2-iminopropanoate deaminase [Gelidibacter algens]
MKLKSVVAITFLTIFLMGCKPSSNAIIFHKSHEPKKQGAPFSDVVESHGFLFLSGQVGMDHNTRTLVEGGIEAETKQCIENIKAVLEHHGSSLDKVIKCTVILRNIDDFAAFNTIYEDYFPNKPARTTFAASGLAVNASIEIDVIASK